MPENKPLSEKDLKEYIRQLLRESRDRDPLKERFLRAKDLRARYGISDPTTYRWINKGLLPKPEFLNGMRVWRLSVIEAAEKKMFVSEKRMPNRMDAS